MSNSEAWYIVKQANQQCTIVPESQVKDALASEVQPEQWGPYASEQEAIARRVGLIRAGKCQPA